MLRIVINNLSSIYASRSPSTPQASRLWKKCLAPPCPVDLSMTLSQLLIPYLHRQSSSWCRFRTWSDFFQPCCFPIFKTPESAHSFGHFKNCHGTTDSHCATCHSYHVFYLLNNILHNSDPYSNNILPFPVSSPIRITPHTPPSPLSSCILSRAAFHSRITLTGQHLSPYERTSLSHGTCCFSAHLHRCFRHHTLSFHLRGSR